MWQRLHQPGSSHHWMERHLPIIQLFTSPPPDKKRNKLLLYLNLYWIFWSIYYTHQNYPNVYELKDVKELAQEKQWHLYVYMSTSRRHRWQDFWPCLSRFISLWHSTLPNVNQSLNKYSLNENELMSYLRDEITFFVFLYFFFISGL